MWIFTDIADWFEEQRKQSDAILDQWVEESDYSQGVMIAAATTKAFTTFGAGFVDLLRIGDGVKEGTAKGIGTDALRVVAVLPVGKVAQMLKSVKGVARAKLIVDTGGPNCFWVASAKALSQIGQKTKGKIFASVDDIAKAIGMPMNNLWVIPNLLTGMTYLTKLGAKVGPIKQVGNLAGIAKMAPKDGSVVMIAVKVMSKNVELGRHAIYAFRDVMGRMRFFDRTVGAKLAGNATRGVYNSIDEIAPVYGATHLIPYEASVIVNVFVKSPAHELPRLVIPVLGVMSTENQ